MDTGARVYACPEGFLLYDAEGDLLHLLDKSGLLKWKAGSRQLPSLFTCPVDGLRVTSAKCSSRWANLDDNGCYQPAVQTDAAFRRSDR